MLTLMPITPCLLTFIDDIIFQLLRYCYIFFLTLLMPLFTLFAGEERWRAADS